MHIVCSDLEGVFVPEVWINVARITGIDELKLTTRDISDYDVLMRRRISILKQHKLTIHDIQKVISEIQPLDGALDFIDWIKQRSQLIIVSDTFLEFAEPLMMQLKRPTLMCNYLVLGEDGTVEDYKLRQPDQKRMVAKAMKSLNYDVLAFGDSYNDISMLSEAHHGFLFCPPEKVVKDYPEFPVAVNYEELKNYLRPFIEL